VTEYLTLDDMLALVGDLEIGPVRDVGLLDSAVHRPTTQLWGSDAYVSLDEKAAALIQSLVGNHALVDGNKRLGWLSLVVFYGLNGVALEVADDDAYDFVIAIDDGSLSEVIDIAVRLQGWSHPSL